jgi:hypothetical protein
VSLTVDGTENIRRGTRHPRLAVVSYAAHTPRVPRSERTQQLLIALRRQWSVELVAASPPESVNSSRPRAGRSFLRKTLHSAHSSVLLDKYELWSLRHLFAWHPKAEAALLIGFPFSPLAYASRRLDALGIPYVVDVGDPWVLTADLPTVRNLASLRARRAERRLWCRASGAIVTTEDQACGLKDLFPELPILVRPNGFPVQDNPTVNIPRWQRGPESMLKIAHFGNLSSARLDIIPFLTSLARSGLWKRIELHVYGSDWTGTLSRARDVTIVLHEPHPWAEIVALAAAYDLALVIGNRDPKQLPSKAIVYLQLPIPRLAVVQNTQADALARYVADKKAWLALRENASDAAELVKQHVLREWSAEELAPPLTESWDLVSAEVARFLKQVLDPAVAAKAQDSRPG